MKELQQALLKVVGQQLARFGFQAKPVGQSFLRPFPGGRASLHIAFIKHREDFDVTADIAVRFDDLEELVNGQNTILTKKEKAQTYSLGAELGNLAGTGQMRWNIKSSIDVDDVAHRVVNSFKELGIPYLDKVSTMQGAFELLTSPGRTAWLYSPAHAARAKRIVGLAKLLGRENNFSTLVEENSRMLESMKDFGLQDFKRFAASLVE